jgi:hypothetical protein
MLYLAVDEGRFAGELASRRSLVAVAYRGGTGKPHDRVRHDFGKAFRIQREQAMRARIGRQILMTFWSRAAQKISSSRLE